MTGTEFKDALDKLRLSQREFAKLTGYTETAICHWSTGLHPTPRLIEVILHSLLDGRIKMEDFRTWLDGVPKKRYPGRGFGNKNSAAANYLNRIQQ